MGIVYLAREVQLNRLVAIKVLPYDLAARDDVRERFLREARTAAGLSHPNIVPIHRVGEAGGLPFFVMTFVKGETLGERLRSRGPVTAPVMTQILRDVAQALAYAHGRGIIHRDIQPDNILLEEDSGRALVTDFGIASVADDSVPTEGMMGTAQFMSPEQVMGEPLDGRSDLYALGVVAHLALSGKLPIDAPSISELMVKRVAEDAPPIGSVASGVPASLARVVDCCLCRDRRERFASAEKLAASLAESAVPARTVLPLP